jgi:hypothetical protein
MVTSPWVTSLSVISVMSVRFFWLVAVPSASQSWASEEVGSTREMQVAVKRMWLWMALTVVLRRSGC